MFLVLEQGHKETRRLVEKNLVAAQALGDQAGVKTARAQLDVIAEVEAVRRRSLAERNVPDVEPYRGPEVTIAQHLEVLYGTTQELFGGQQKELTPVEKENWKAFGAAAKLPVAIINAVARGGILSPEELYRKSEEDIYGLRHIGGDRTKQIVQALKQFYPQFRTTLLQPPQNQGQ